jgi:membrane protein
MIRIGMKLRKLKRISAAAFNEWQHDQASHKAAALAYYTTFSLAPLLILVIAIAGLFGGRDAASGLVMAQIQDLVGKEGRDFVQSMIENAAARESTGIIATTLGSLTLIVGAIAAFMQLQTSLNQIWKVEVKPVDRWSVRIRDFIFQRLMSFSMVVGIGFLLLVSLVVDAGLAAIEELMAGVPHFSQILLESLNAVFSLGIITVLFALLYKFIPDLKIKWKHVWPGALLTAVLFTIGKTLIGVYLGQSEVASTFGAAGSLALIMIWIYYSAQIVFFGAEFCQVYSVDIDDIPVPTIHAVEKPEA